jgi:hypothetical protein
MTPESRLLLDCLRGAAPQEIPAGLDWHALIRLASRHAVLPLLSRSLLDVCPERTELRECLQQNAANSLRLTAELVKILGLLEQHNIQALPFKGPFLAESVYGNLALREFCDLDILVRPADVLKARDVLLSHGYRTDLPTEPAQQAAYLRARHEIHFTLEDGGGLVEIHQCFLPPFYRFPLPDDSLWDRLQPITRFGRRVMTLAPDDLLLVLCAHGAKHCWSQLGWIVDVAKLASVHGQAMDWPSLVRRAHALGLERLLLLGLFLAADLLNAPVPEDILRRARAGRTLQSLAGQVRRSLFSEDSTSPGEWQTHRFFLRARERLSDKLAYCLRLAATPTEGDYALVKLPSGLSFLYYPIHMVRLIAKYGFGSRVRVLKVLA